MRILCQLPNAADLINGVEFVAHAAGKLSVEVAEEVGKAFLAIPGYVLHEEAPVVSTEPAAAAAATADAVADAAVDAADAAAASAAAADAAAGDAPAEADAPAADAAATTAKRGKKA